MPYKISWYKDDVMWVEVSGVVTSEELLAITAESFAMVEAATQRIHAIVDQSKVESMPRSMSALVKSVPRNRHPNQGITILIIPTMGRAERFISSVLLQLLGLEYRITQSLEESVALLEKQKTLY